MADYELSEFGRLPWLSAGQALRFGLAIFAAGLGAWFRWVTYLNAISRGVAAPYIVGAAFIYFILGMLLYVAEIMRAPATRLAIDKGSDQLLYRRGPSYIQTWSDPNLVIRG
jgi:hypothetical protein